MDCTRFVPISNNMARICLSLVACVVALATQVTSQPPACTTVTWGNTMAIPHPVPPVTLAPGVPEWEITINGYQECPPELTVGAVATVCDYDSPPIVKFTDPLHLLVYRTGSTSLPGVAAVTLYCLAYAHARDQSAGPAIDAVAKPMQNVLKMIGKV